MTDWQDEFKTNDIVKYSVFPLFRHKIGIVQSDGNVRILDEELVQQFTKSGVSLTCPIGEVQEIEHEKIGERIREAV